MLFNSFQFLIFFPVVTALYFLLPHKWRWLHLLVASCVFYCAFIPVYILILFFTIGIDYVAGIAIENATNPRRKAFLIVSLVANIGVLAVFKYYNFFVGNVDTLLHGFGLAGNALPFLDIILPIGLSFHTFQAMSYTIEVYRGNQKAERHLGIYALYVMFYPQLVAGPIERPQNVLHQFHEKHDFDNYRVAHGLRIMLWGYLMKVVVADRLAIYVNAVYNNAHQHNGTTLALATIFFAFQIYCDFAGYSYIAIGAAEVMGIKLMTNFRRPYFSKSIAEFWSRWHISLSTWFRDYLYIPLGGNRRSVPRRYFNLFFVFLVSGLWHGANWTFVIWGALNGFYLIFAIVTKDLRERVAERLGLLRYPRLFEATQILVTFLLASFAWIFFRASSLEVATTVVSRIFTQPGRLYLGDNPALLFNCFLAIAVLLLIEFRHEYATGAFSFANNRNPYVRYASYVAAVTVLLLLGVFDGGQFIYFQF